MDGASPQAMEAGWLGLDIVRDSVGRGLSQICTCNRAYSQFKVAIEEITSDVAFIPYCQSLC